MPTRSYQSQVELPVSLGLGKLERVDEVRVVWPGGMVETVENLDADRIHVIRRGLRVVSMGAGQPAQRNKLGLVLGVAFVATGTCKERRYAPVVTLIATQGCVRAFELEGMLE